MHKVNNKKNGKKKVPKGGSVFKFRLIETKYLCLRLINNTGKT